MREIKFRAWDKDDKTMFEDVDVLRNGSIIYFELDANSNEPIHWYDNYGDSYEEEFANKFVVMQYTGLKDKNGEEIYEGDILKLCLLDYAEIEEDIFTIQADTFYGDVCYLENIAKDSKESETDFIEVIGNIYANPELIEG